MPPPPPIETLWCKNHQNLSDRKSHTWAPLMLLVGGHTLISPQCKWMETKSFRIFCTQQKYVTTSKLLNFRLCNSKKSPLKSIGFKYLHLKKTLFLVSGLSLPTGTLEDLKITSQNIILTFFYQIKQIWHISKINFRFWSHFMNFGFKI